MKEPIPKGYLLLIEEIIQMIVAMTIGHSEVKDILMKEKDHQRKRGIQKEIEHLQEEEDYTIMEDPQIGMEVTLEEEDPLMEEDHLMEEDPLMMEGHLMEMEDPHDALIEEDLEDLLDQ